MAIYHLSTKPVSRSSGRTATASIAYRAGIAIKDERTGKEHDYTKRSGVAYTQLHTPNGLKIKRNELWNLAETTETRKNSRTAREIVVNLPHELSGRLRMMLVNDFAKDLANQYGVAVDVAIHTPDAQGDNRNHHAHIMLTTRKLERLESGRVALTSKSQLEMSNTQLKERGLPSAREELKAIREQWANITNKHLKEAKIDARIDHRSHKDRGLEQLPTKKLGWEASALERKGIKTSTGDYNRKVEEYNHAMQQLAIIEKSLNAVTEQREQSNDRLREGIERAVKLIENATQNTAWADRNTKLVTQVVGECQRELEGAEREINASASAID
ncbi:MobQ family relaxase, partial [Psychrobacter sp. 364]